jgi:hypothetical protein
VNTPRRLSDSQKPTQKLHQKTTQPPQNTTKPSQPKRTQPTQHHIHRPTPLGAWDVGACARDGGAIKGDGVGVVCGDGVEGMAEQVLEGGVGGEVALEVSVVAVGDVVGVGVLGACELGDGFSCGGDKFGACELLEGAVGFGSCGVEGCGADEVLEVVYWVCVVVLPIGLSCPVKFVVCHSRDRDTRWAFCCSRGCGCGDVKMADFRVPPASRGEPKRGSVPPASRGEPKGLGSPCLQGEP